MNKRLKRYAVPQTEIIAANIRPVMLDLSKDDDDFGIQGAKENNDDDWDEWDKVESIWSN